MGRTRTALPARGRGGAPHSLPGRLPDGSGVRDLTARGDDPILAVHGTTRSDMDVVLKRVPGGNRCGYTLF